MNDFINYLMKIDSNSIFDFYLHFSYLLDFLFLHKNIYFSSFKYESIISDTLYTLFKKKKLKVINKFD